MKKLFLLLLIMSLLSACTASPTRVPTKTKTPLATKTKQPTPTRTAKPISLAACVTDSTINIRRGPGREFEAVGGIASGKCVSILGRNQDSTWVFIRADQDSVAGENIGWVLASLLTIEGNLQSVSVRTASNALSLAPTQRSQPTATRKPIILMTYTPRPTVSSMMPCSQTINSIGDSVSCKIERASCDYLPDTNGSPTFCNDKPYPNQDFALVVFGENWSDLDGYCLVVRGVVQIYRGTPQIVASSRSQVSYCD